MTVLSWLRFGDFFVPEDAPFSAGGGTPIPSAIRIARSPSTLFMRSTTLFLTPKSETFPSSKWKALMICSFSASDMLFQKSFAWLKWSLNFSLRARIFFASIFSWWWA